MFFNGKFNSTLDEFSLLLLDPAHDVVGKVTVADGLVPQQTLGAAHEVGNSVPALEELTAVRGVWQVVGLRGIVRRTRGDRTQLALDILLGVAAAHLVVVELVVGTRVQNGAVVLAAVVALAGRRIGEQLPAGGGVAGGELGRDAVGCGEQGEKECHCGEGHEAIHYCLSFRAAVKGGLMDKSRASFLFILRHDRPVQRWSAMDGDFWCCGQQGMFCDKNRTFLGR